MCVSHVVEEELARAYPGIEERLVRVENGVDVERFHPREREAARAKLLEELARERPNAKKATRKSSKKAAAKKASKDDAQQDAKAAEAVDAPEELGPILSLVARNPELKGLPTLLEALSGLTDERWHLLVAGPKDVRRWRAPVKRAGLEGRVTLRPDLDPVTLAAGSDLYVLPSWRDPSPLTVLESLACGTPVVTTQASGGSELIRPGVAGAVIERPGDAQSLRAALEEWIARTAAGDVERDAVRACVRGRDAAAWLGRLERLVVALAGESGDRPAGAASEPAEVSDASAPPQATGASGSTEDGARGASSPDADVAGGEPVRARR